MIIQRTSRFATLAGIVFIASSHDSTAATAVVVDSLGRVLGIPFDYDNDPPQVVVITRTGYVVRFNETGLIATYISDITGNSFMGTAQFESTDCTGQPLLALAQTTVPGGVVIAADLPDAWGSALVYVPKLPTGPVKTLKSTLNSYSGCTLNYSPYTTMAIIPLPNDPAVTGVLGNATPPFHVEIVSDCVFSNGFECSGNTSRPAGLRVQAR